MWLIKRLAIAAVAVFMLIPSILVRRNADGIIRSSYELFQQGQRPTLDDIRHRFGHELKQTGPCKDFGCGYEVVVSNRLLARLHLTQLTTLRSSFWVRDGSVDENILEFWTVREDGGIILSYTDAKYCGTCNAFWAGGNSVRIDSGSQAPEKRAAFGFNTSCFLSVQRCASATELLPAVRRD
jgi:hypothetical protein